MPNKELTDDELVKLGEDFARLNLIDRDNVVFDFEVDSIKMIKNLNLRKLIKRNKKYMHDVKNFFMQIVLQAYLKDIIKVGNKKVNRYKRFYLEAV